jgi:hypothetical protein
MTLLAAALLPSLLAATIDVPAGTDLRAALASARPGDEVRLGPGLHAGSLGRVRGPLRIAGTGAGITVVASPEGEDGLVVEAGAVAVTGLSLSAGGPRTSLKVLGGEVTLDGVALSGGAVGAFVDGGRLEARDVDLSGGYGLLLHAGQVSIAAGRVHGVRAGLAQLGGRSELRRLLVVGPSIEAGVSISGGTAFLDDVVIRAPGPSGLSVLGDARVEARSLDVSGATEEQQVLGDCVQVRRGTLRIEAGVLTRCGGAAVEASGGTLDLRGVDASGGEAGCLIFLDHATARLDGNRCTRRGPAVVSAGGAQVWATMNRWLTDPVLWVECGSGARVHLGVGETAREPCQKHGESLDKPGRP